MAKIVSAVPKLLTATLGSLASDPPKPTAIPVVAPAAIPAAVAETKANTDIAGPELSDDLDPITDRSRGRNGTITTSFRGVLNDSASILPRRTLLGE